MQSTQEPYSWIAKLSNIGTYFCTMLSGKYVGKDRFGNRYYSEKKHADALREKRWVIYNGRPEASLVPPEWHGWLHYTLDEPLPEESEFHRPWIKPHEPNLTFSDDGYRPPALKTGKREHATGDYQPWQPGQNPKSK